MDLSQPPNDYLAEIDRKLQQVSEETQLMREKFGFTADMNEAETIIAIKKRAKQAVQPKKYDDKGSGRLDVDLRFNYDTLVDVIPEEQEIKPTVVKPEISAEWVAANKMEPDLKVFYDKERFEKQIFRREDFALTKERIAPLEAYDSYMSSFSQLM